MSGDSSVTVCRHCKAEIIHLWMRWWYSIEDEPNPYCKGSRTLHEPDDLKPPTVHTGSIDEYLAEPAPAEQPRTAIERAAERDLKVITEPIDWEAVETKCDCSPVAASPAEGPRQNLIINPSDPLPSPDREYYPDHNEDYWIAACLHILLCPWTNCSVCNRLRVEIEKEHPDVKAI